MRTSTIEMIEAAEALDIFLSKFTREIQLKPDQIKDFLQILEQIEVVAKWFTDKSGDKFAAIFEAFQNGDPAVNPITGLNAYADTLTVNN